MGNAFFGFHNLGTHPAYIDYSVGLRCPLCPGDQAFETKRVKEYDRHFLAHQPSREVAYKYLSAGSWERYAAKCGWLDAEELREIALRKLRAKRRRGRILGPIGDAEHAAEEAEILMEYEQMTSKGSK